MKKEETKKKNEKEKNSVKKEAKQDIVEEEVLVETTKVVEKKKGVSIVYYVLLFITIISTALLGLAGYKKIEAGDTYASIVKNAGGDQAYVDYYFGNHQAEGFSYLGLAGAVFTFGLYASNSMKRK